MAPAGRRHKPNNTDQAHPLQRVGLRSGEFPFFRGPEVGMSRPRGDAMRGGASFRRAVAASVGAHALLAAGLVLLARWQADRPQEAPRPPAIDTRVDVRIGFLADGPNVLVETPRVTTPAARQEPPEPEPPRLEETGGSRPPLARSVPIPRTLPPELLALVRKTATASDVVEVPAPPAEVRPAGGAVASHLPTGPAWAAGGSLVHGPLAPGLAIVYVLDASGSMGAHGKFDTARRALVATLRSQPETVRFQVVVYAGAASVPLPAGGCMPATAENIARVIGALQAVAAPAGRSHHVEGLQKALSLRPDLVLVFTDADDLPTPVLRGVLKQAAKPAVVCVAKVAAGRVEQPIEVK